MISNNENEINFEVLEDFEEFKTFLQQKTPSWLSLSISVSLSLSLSIYLSIYLSAPTLTLSILPFPYTPSPHTYLLPDLSSFLCLKCTMYIVFFAILIRL